MIVRPALAVASVLALSACGATRISPVDQRLALAIACQEYGAVANSLAADIDADRIDPLDVEQIAIAQEAVGPMCTDQSRADPAAALVAVRSAVTRITLARMGEG